MASIVTSFPSPTDQRIARLLDAQQAVLALIAQNAPLSDTLSAIARFSEQWIPGMKGSILVWDDRKGRLGRGGYGALPDSFADVVDGLVPAANAGSCGACAFERRRVISEDVFTDPRWDAFHGLCRQYEIRSAWSSPLLASRDGTLLGVFGMYHSDVRPMIRADEDLVDHFTALASLAIERHNEESLQRHQATHDVLTGLGNRRLLEQAGSAYLQRALDEDTPLSVAFIDLDNFKAINDTFGHILGDALLCSVATHMRRHFGDDTLIARFGGDEFIVVCTEPSNRTLEQLEALRVTLAKAVQMGHLSVEIRFSAGVVEYRRQSEGSKFDALISQSDEMARRAKLLGGDRSVSAALEDTQRWAFRQRLALDMTQALHDSDAIQPHLQPIVSIPDAQLQGFELLLRLKNPALRGVSIGDCIAVAEHTGMIHEIGHRMLRHGFALLEEHRALDGLYLNVNVSVRQLLSRNFLDGLRDLIERYPTVAARVCLEVTESHWLDSTGAAGDVLRAIKRMGLQLSLDDFGTGHASLSYLQSLPFDSVKIDRHFVEHIETNARDRSVCVALLAMARSCGMSAVAEGVETLSQARELCDLGYDRAQGYLWAKPMPIEEALVWMQSHHAMRSSRGPADSAEAATEEATERARPGAYDGYRYSVQFAS